MTGSPGSPNWPVAHFRGAADTIDWDVRFHFCAAKGHPAASLMTCTSTRRADSSDYVHNAWVPDGDWRLGTEREFESRFGSETSFSPSTDVAVVDAPGPVQDDVAALRNMLERFRPMSALAENGSTSSSGNSSIDEETILRRIEGVAARFTAWARMLATGDDLTIHRPDWVPGNRATTTFGEQSLLIGLHLDSWDRLPYAARAGARNRLCLNLGPVARHLMVVPLTVARFVALHPESVTPAEGRAFREVFFATLVRTPVIAIRIDPGQAYIAPTENVLHDGSSMGHEATCWILTARGRFNRPLQC